MLSALRRATLLAAVLIAAPVAQATEVGWRIVPSPLDGTPSKVHELRATNVQGGFDSDLCRYSTRGQWRTYALATSPSDLFTVYNEDFEQVRDEHVTVALKAEAQRARAGISDPDALEVWDRYALAARFYRILGKDEAFLGQLLHEGSWTVRDEVVGVYVGLEGPAAAHELLRLGEVELRKDLATEDRKKVLHNLARVAERYGDAALRDRYLDQLLALPALSAEERGKVERMATLAREVEPRFQDQALEHYLAYLRQPGVPRESLVRVTYLAADLLRRRGRLVEAVPLYSLVATAEDAPRELREMALFLADQIVDEAEDRHGR
jgi:hypothetical protein